MKLFIPSLSLLFFFTSLTSYADPVQSLESFRCVSFDQNYKIEGQKSDCQDSRYQKWQKNGCYSVRVFDANGLAFYEEMVRSVSFQLEIQQKFYSMYVWDAQEWATRSFILEFDPREGFDGILFQFDHRKSSQGAFKSIKGVCPEVTH